MIIKNVFLLCVLCIVVFNIYSLFRILNAYWFKTKSMKSFDLKLNTRHKENLRNFDNSFIVGNISSTFLLFSFVWTDTGIEWLDDIKKNMTTSIVIRVLWIAIMMCRITEWCVLRDRGASSLPPLF